MDAPTTRPKIDPRNQFGSYLPQLRFPTYHCKNKGDRQCERNANGQSNAKRLVKDDYGDTCEMDVPWFRLDATIKTVVPLA